MEQRVTEPELCGCGRPLHYVDPETELTVRDLVATLGPNLLVQLGGRSWLVPRHYIALHGLKAQDLPELALRYGWQQA
jgi:hypothetical protein